MNTKRTLPQLVSVAAAVCASSSVVSAGEPCESAGAFTGTFDDDPSDGLINFSRDAIGSIRLLISAGDSSVKGVANGAVELSGTHQVKKGHSTFSGAVGSSATFEGKFSTSRRLTGTWEGPDEEGTLNAWRVGGASDASARFTGEVSGDFDGYVVFDINDDNEATGAVLGPNLQVTDTLSGSVTDGTLEAATSQGATLTGTVDIAAGLFSGNWSFGDLSGSFTGQGCQLPDDVKVKVDYRFDTNNFFDTPEKRRALEQALQSMADRLDDNLAAIEPTGDNTWDLNFSPPGATGLVTIEEPTIESDTLRVFVGATDLGPSAIASPITAVGGTGSAVDWSGDDEFIDALLYRGQSGVTTDPATATDYAPIGGTITFDSTKDWFFGADLRERESGEASFRDVATHEFGHILGYNRSIAAWEAHVADSGQTFTGQAATAAFDRSGSPPLNRGVHWAPVESDSEFRDEESLKDGGRLTLMGSGTPAPTELDWAALADTGWEVEGFGP